MPISSPSTELYTLGRGILSIGAWSGETPPGSVSDVGNCTEFNLTVTEEKLEHYSYRSGIRSKDKEVTLESGYEGNFILDEISQANMLMFFKGTLSGTTIRANTALDEEYELQFAAANPIGEKNNWTFHRVKLSPNGEFGLISDEWAGLNFSFSGLDDTANNPNSPWFDIEYQTTTTA